jgi:hypothetical protein
MAINNAGIQINGTRYQWQQPPTTSQQQHRGTEQAGQRQGNVEVTNEQVYRITRHGVT